MYTNNRKGRRMKNNLIYAGILLLLCVFSGCRNEAAEEKEKISSIELDTESVTLGVNEEVIVRIKAGTEAAKKNEQIKFTATPEGFVEIREPNNDGFVIKGIKGGSTIIRIESKYVVKLLEVKILGEDVLARYIKLEKPVIEVNEGSRVTTSVSLYGGITEGDDNLLFDWRLESGKNNIGISATGNIAVIQGIERGYQEINISHPRSDFTNKILVFVKGIDEEIKYIYRESNILMLPNDGQYHDFDVALINGVPSDAVGFEYSVVQGQGNIEISGSQTKCNVLGVRSGASIIRVHHDLAVVDFDVRVIVYDVDMPYIALDQSFVLLSVQESARVTAEVMYARNGTAHKGQFHYQIIENDAVVADENQSIIEVIQTNESFYIRAKRMGTARIVISNEQAEMAREALVVVREDAAYRDDYYITTTQNVITTQVGAGMTRLYVTLVNGNQGHANGFIWDVDDSSVAKLYTNHGTARNRAQVQQVFEAYAEIEPLKAGAAKIVITNSSFPETQAQVIVRVYPKGTFANPPVQVGYDGLIKVEYGNPHTVNLRVTAGSESEVGDLNWEIADTGIATLYGNAHSTVNVLSAVRQNDGGITRMKVTGDNLEFPHESIVIAGDEDYINRTQIIYVDSIYQKVVEQQTIDVHVLNSKTKSDGKPDESWQPYGFSAQVAKPDIAYAVMVQNVLKIMGKERGETDIVVSHSGAANESITLYVRVEPAGISIDQPYYISGDDIKGVVRAIPTEFSVSMPGAPDSELNKLAWRSDDSSVVTIGGGSGPAALLTGKVSGRQAKVWVSHRNNKAEEKPILVYVVDSAEDLRNVVLGAKQENYLLKTGQEQLVTIITNANDAQKRNISWSVSTKPGDPAPVTIDPHYDSAMIRAVTAGNATLEVTYTDYDENGAPTGKHTLPLSIYVSVVDALGADKIIRGPAVIEIIRGESKIIGVEHLNLTQDEIMGIKWAVEAEGDPLANMEGNGDSAYLYGLRKGVGKVKIWQDRLRYEHYATLICANSLEELASMYVMGVDSSYQKMMIGEEKKVKLTFGSNGFPETAKRNLVWTADSSGKVKIAGSPGESVSIIAQEPGEATVKVRDANNPKVSFNEEIEIKFLVIDPNHSSLEFRGHQKMVGIVVGQSKQVGMRLFDNDEEIKNYGLWEHETEKANIVNVNRVDGDPSGQVLDIRALSVGESYITVRYDDKVSAKILVYTALTANDLENYYPILVEKTNYLLQIGQTAVVRIETMEEKDAENFSKVSWGVDNAGVIGNANFNGQKEVTIRGAQAGNCVISVNYNNETKARIFITVVSNDVIDMEKYIVTENIIGMVINEQKTTKVFSNLGSEASKIVWESLNQSIVSVSGTGEEARLTANTVGETYVTVTYGSWLKRHIRVYVCAGKPNVESYRAMNMENQYYRAGVGETLMLPVYFAQVKSTVATMWVDKYENKVVRFSPQENGSKIEVTTQSEGVAVLEAINTGISDPSHVLRIYIEVSNQYNGAPRPVVDRFLTISRTIYVMNPDNKDEELNLRVSGVGYTVEELAGVTWELMSGGDYISIYPNGQECRVRVNPVGKEGTAEIRVSKTENEVLIKIVVSKTGMLGFPHIVGEDTVRVGMGGKVLIPYEVAEAVNYDLNAFFVQVMNGGELISAKFNQNILEVEGKMSGQAKLRITCVPVCSASHYKDVAVQVTTTMDGIVYLTTRDNFTQVKIGEVKTLNVEMVGMENSGDAGYRWFIDEADEEYKSYLQLNYTGRQAQVTGLKAGAGKTVRIKIQNKLYVDPMFDLVIYVRISDNFFNNIYLTTNKNIVSIVEGKSTYLTAELVNGEPGEENKISWISFNTDVAEAYGAGTQAYIMGKKVGFARVQAQYSNAVNDFIEILVIVEKDTTGEGIYITSGDTLVQLKPGDTREVSVRLVGGGLGDEAGFRWEVYTQTPVIAGKEVVQIIGGLSGIDRTFIKGINEGQATIRVTHPARTSYVLEMMIYVQEYNKVEFNTKTLTVKQGEEKVVRVSMPPNTQLIYTVSNDELISLSDKGPTSSVFLVIKGIRKGICTVQVNATDKMLSDEMIVTVEEVNNRLLQYIETNDTIFNMVDWESAANRVMVSGLPVGEKEGGGEFTEADSLGLQWEITGGKEFIEFDAVSAGSATKAAGKIASVKSKRTGTAQITVKHNEMKDYAKNIYVNVIPYDAHFMLSPSFAGMRVYEDAPFTVNITGNNIDLDDYKKVTWRLLPNEKSVRGVEFVGESGDGLYEITGRKSQSVRVLAKNEGIYKIKVLYDGHELEGLIYVEPPKALEVYDESFVKVVPGTTVFIGLYHEPLLSPGAQFTVNTDYNAFADIGYYGPIRRKDANDIIGPVDTSLLPADRTYNGDYGQKVTYPIMSAFTPNAQKAILDQNYNALLVVHGKDREGYTQIKITYMNIERIVTIHNSNDYSFNMVGITQINNVKYPDIYKTTSVRGKPGDKVTIKYEIAPMQSEIRHGNIVDYQGESLSFNGSEMLPGNELQVLPGGRQLVVFGSDSMDFINQTITFTLKQCGYALLRFENVFYNSMGKYLEIPVFICYDKINVEWKAQRTGKSRLDELSNAIYIANNETLYINIETGNDTVNNGNICVKGYPGDDLDFVEIKMSNSNSSVKEEKKGATYTSPSSMGSKKINFGYWERNTNVFRFRITGDSSLGSTNGKNILQEVTYIGTLEVSYVYSNGGIKKTDNTVIKRFLVYTERW